MDKSNHLKVLLHSLLLKVGEILNIENVMVLAKVNDLGIKKKMLPQLPHVSSGYLS